MISYLTKIGDNEFRIDFNSEIWIRRSKSVVVDGETYYKEWTDTERIDSKIDFNNAGEVEDYWHEESRKYHDKQKGKWERLVINEFFDYNGEIYYVWNYTGFLYSPAESLSGYSSSTVGKVRILNALVNNNHVKGIYSISSGKINDLPYKYQYEDIIKSRKVYFDIMGYGFNNGVSIGINLYSLLRMDLVDKKGTWFYDQFKNKSDYMPKLFPRKMLEKKLSETERLDILINILNNSINLKEQRKL